MYIFGKIGILFLILSIIIRSNIVNTSDNNRPIIGILAQETEYYNSLLQGEKSYIAASYVKFIESAGARVVPIWIGKSKSYYRNLLGNINGVLWPGGAADIYREYGYGDAGYKIYQIAKEMNDAGKHFPILGICLGFELLTYVAAGKVPHRTECSSQSQALPLNFDINYVESNLFKNASPEIIEILSTKKVTINFHHFCITDQALRTVNLNNIFRVTSRNFDTTGIEFISSLEHKDYPFYGLQFHPEKNLFEWVIGKKIPHGFNAIKIGQYFANFFVNEARKNDNQFRDDESEVRSLIYNYNPFYTGSNNKTFQQIYLFPKN